MAVDDTTIYVVLLTLLNFGLVYRSDRLIGGIFFTFIGLGVMSIHTSYAWMGFMILGIGMYSLIDSWLRFPKSNEGIFGKKK